MYENHTHNSRHHPGGREKTGSGKTMHRECSCRGCLAFLPLQQTAGNARTGFGTLADLWIRRFATGGGPAGQRRHAGANGSPWTGLYAVSRAEMGDSVLAGPAWVSFPERNVCAEHDSLIPSGPHRYSRPSISPSGRAAGCGGLDSITICRPETEDFSKACITSSA